jgi:hypothetical protein
LTIPWKNADIIGSKEYIRILKLALQEQQSQEERRKRGLPSCKSISKEMVI